MARPTSLLPLLALVACALPTDDTADTAAADGSDGGSTASVDDDGTSGAPSDASGSDDDDTSAGDTTGSDDTATTTGTDPASSCPEATLHMGSPYFTGDLEGWNPAGQGLLDEPPLRSRHLAPSGDRLAVETQSEVWLADATTVHRIAGDELEPELQYQPTGSCADVRFVIASGIAGLPNGDLVVTDVRGNGVVELRDPQGTCTAAPIAGNPDQTFDVDIEGAAASGDVDGPGATARFFGVERPTADADGNIYVVDPGNTKIKRIANDADRTVTTIHDYMGDDMPLGLTVLDGMLYVVGSNPIEDFVWAIDPATATQEVLFAGKGLFEEVDSSQQASLVALTHDGVDLIALSNKGFVFRLSTTAEPLGAIAGYGSALDFPPDLDLAGPIAAGELPIRSYGVNDGAILRMGDDILVANLAAGVGFHVWSIHCR